MIRSKIALILLIMIIFSSLSVCAVMSVDIGGSGDVDLSAYVPYVGATNDVNIGSNDFITSSEIFLTGASVNTVNIGDEIVTNLYELELGVSGSLSKLESYGSSGLSIRASYPSSNLAFSASGDLYLTPDGEVNVGTNLDVAENITSDNSLHISEIHDSIYGGKIFDITNQIILDSFGTKILEFGFNKGFFDFSGDLSLEWDARQFYGSDGSTVMIDYSSVGEVNTGTNSFKANKIAIGSNSLTGLSAGDINVSTIYKDSEIFKSQRISCDQHSTKCQVYDFDTDKTITMNIQQDWRIINITYNNQTYTKQGFWNVVEGTKYEPIALNLNSKLKFKQDQYDCQSQGYMFNATGCYNTVQLDSTYEESTYSYTRDITYEEDYGCTTLDESLQVVESICQRKVFNGTKTLYQFEDRCGWNNETGYYCMKEVLVE